jgi:hypothetical protein
MELSQKLPDLMFVVLDHMYHIQKDGADVRVL